TVQLVTQPTANVTIPIASSDTTEGTTSVTQLVFTPVNWHSAQTVTVTGVDDSIADGDQPYTIMLAPVTSSDPVSLSRFVTATSAGSRPLYTGSLLVTGA